MTELNSFSYESAGQRHEYATMTAGKNAGEVVVNHITTDLATGKKVVSRTETIKSFKIIPDTVTIRDVTKEAKPTAEVANKLTSILPRIKDRLADAAVKVLKALKK